ncbi:uncharacterized protein bou isoform X1 [Cloeon dipterum]|uniref:uncharacterized protein bou isoform X1 n=1 Tax=Cloeon dipterum TaxID=197152 RepID=UPI00321F656B
MGPSMVLLTAALVLAARPTSAVINCYQCSSTDHEDPYTCNELFNVDGDPDGFLPPVKPCDQVHGASYCIKQTGRFEGSQTLYLPLYLFFTLTLLTTCRKLTLDGCAAFINISNACSVQRLTALHFSFQPPATFSKRAIVSRPSVHLAVTARRDSAQHSTWATTATSCVSQATTWSTARASTPAAATAATLPPERWSWRHCF